jgi:radical SAM-linked protein
LKSRLSPPCGKTIGSFVHYTNVESAEADKRPLVCYDCGVACDLSQMRTERIDFLSKMGAHHRLPVIPREPRAPARSKRIPAKRPPGTAPQRYRFRFEKIGPTALLGHLDLVRSMPRVMRRIGAPLAYSQGFHPRPDLTFSPALSLGVLSLSEFVDVKLLAELDVDAALEDMNAAADEGLVFAAGARLGPEDAGITKIVTGARYLIVVANAVMGELGGEAWLRKGLERFLSAPEHKVRREIEGLAKYVDVRSYVTRARVAGDDARSFVGRAGLVGDLTILEVDVKILGSGGVKTVEIVEAITEEAGLPHRAIRTALYAERAGIEVDPMNLAALRRARPLGAATDDGAAEKAVMSASS